MHTNNILKPYTIIPPHLYVNRDADRQVENIVKDMGRPGYVLVSRQMGKTNLLLNAKRNLETKDDIFVYIDLSNPFDSAKTCFENIIDTAIEINIERFESISEVIYEKRKQLTSIPPHKQHTDELRLLLSCIKGKLVIILDEIDALTKTSYSDLIFAQIRSIYFSRVNFKELEKLTYLLSGVIEPIEIIKDPKISPFNIGQKIFLNDFSKQEFYEFIKISRLEVEVDILERIFYWTNGNPRMTWDVCAEVEIYIKEKTINTNLVDKIVQNLYLQKFDKPPIDNIRELVIQDRDIRNAIVEIEYKKGNEVSDRIKNKLYLAGIINYTDDDILIKNEIIKQSLNLEWIKSVEENDKGLLRIGIENYDREEYSECIINLERFIDENKLIKLNLNTPNYYLGAAYFKIKQYKKAIEYLDNTNFDEQDEAAFYYTTVNFKGSAYYYLGNISQSLAHLRITIDSGRKGIEYALALINYGTTLLKSLEKQQTEEAVKIFQGIIDETGLKKDKLQDSFIRYLKSISHYNLALIQSTGGELGESIESFRQSVELSSLNQKPPILLALFNITKDETERDKILTELVDLITHQGARPIENNSENPITFSFDHLKKILILVYKTNNLSRFDELKPFFNLLGERSYIQHLFDLSTFTLNVNQDWVTSQNFLLEIYNLSEDSEFAEDNEIFYQTLKLLAYFASELDQSRHRKQYIQLFNYERIDPIDFVDLEIFSNHIYELIEKKRYVEAIDKITLIRTLMPLAPLDIHINYLVILNLELNVVVALKNKKRQQEVAESVLLMIEDENIKNQSSNLLSEKGIKIIKQNAEQILRNEQIKSPLVKDSSYGRNQIVSVKYKDGTIINSKYKRIEKDLIDGLCLILK